MRILQIGKLVRIYLIFLAAIPRPYIYTTTFACLMPTLTESPLPASYSSSASMSSSKSLLISNRRTDSTFEEIPVIDLSRASSLDPSVRKALSEEIRDACINVGFFYISNHGIPEDTIEHTIEAAKRFFALPTEKKIELDIHKSINFKGYTALLAENTDVNNKGDLHEGFDLGPEYVARQDGSDGTAMNDGGNVWPEESLLPGFREEVLEYYNASIELGKRLFPLFALALDLPETFFDDKTMNAAAIMRLLHYPPQNVDHDKVMGIGAHTDYECFTMLWQDYSVPALQVQNTDGKWIEAVPIPGTIVVNLGDQFARWTNDVFKSTMHRAINRTGSERYSIPVFFGTDYHVRLEPIPTCVSEDDPPKYEVVTAGEYVKSRLEATYAQSKSM